MTLDCSQGEVFTVAVTNGKPFTITAINQYPGELVVLDVFNKTGGTLGAVTFGSGIQGGRLHAPGTGRPSGDHVPVGRHQPPRDRANVGGRARLSRRQVTALWRRHRECISVGRMRMPGSATRILLGAGVIAAACGGSDAPGQMTVNVPQHGRVFVLVEENRDYAAVVASGRCPTSTR